MVKAIAKALAKFGLLLTIAVFVITFVIAPFSRHVLGGKKIVDTLEYTWRKHDQPGRDNLPLTKKWIVKLSYADSFVKVVLINLAKLPSLASAYFKNSHLAYKREIQIADEHFSVAVSFNDIRVEALRKYLEELGARHVLVRVPYYRGKVFRHMNKEEIERGIIQLVKDGKMNVVISILQSREAVNDIPSWKAHLKETFDTFKPYVDHYIIGHAPNRGKWGIWDFGMDEYYALFKAAEEVIGLYPTLKLIGPSVIDFEWPYMVAILKSLKSEKIDIINSLLYVDRRDAPEDTHMGFNTADKVTMIRAVADLYSQKVPLWITEVNWTLEGQGIYRPSGGGVSEEAYANYLVRYYLLTVCSGFVERVYWWQMIAKGYGLIDNTDGVYRKRPGFYALKTLRNQLIGSTFLWRLAADNYYIFAFRKNDEVIYVMWTKEGVLTMQLPAEGQIISRDGYDKGKSHRVAINEEPIYVHISSFN